SSDRNGCFTTKLSNVSMVCICITRFLSLFWTAIRSVILHSAFHDGVDLLSQKLFACGLQPLHQDLSNTLHQFVAKTGITLGGDQEVSAVQDNGGGRFQGATLEVPDEGRKQP